MSETKRRFKPTGIYKENVRMFYTVKYSGEEYFVPMLEFQKQHVNLSQELNCIVKQDGSNISIVQDFASIIQELYTVGETYQFSFREHLGNYARVIDNNGIVCRLTQGNKKKLVFGQTISARVLKIDGLVVELSLVEESVQTVAERFLSLTEVADKLNISDESRAFLNQQILAANTFDAARKLHEMHDPMWIIEAISRMDELLLANKHNASNGYELARIFKRLCIFILEESPFLKRQSPDNRKELIARINAMAQHADDYLEAYRIISEGNSRNYVARQLENLMESGNLYRPENKLRIMMCLFNLDEKIMSEMMERIFDIILSGDKTNWSTEPFRTAFVETLEMFINEYRHKAVKMRGTDMLFKVIRAIAIQQLLSCNDDAIDRRLNRATFYRLLSYVQRFASDTILDDAFNSLFLPYDDNIEYEWDDVSNLDSLYYKVAYRQRQAATHKIGRQFYRGNELEFVVDDINASLMTDPSADKCANTSSFLHWRALKILTHETLKAKVKDPNSLNEVARFWKELDKAIYVKPEVSIKHRKTRPVPGDFVEIKIVDEDESYSSLYCEICDEEYEGSGWLEFNEVVRYLQSGSSNIHFFKDRDGKPLHFNAKIIKPQGSSGELEFSLLQEINECIRQMYQYGDEIICSVKSFDRNDRKVMIALSTDGVPCRIHLEEGQTLEIGDRAVCVIDEVNRSGQYECSFKELSDTAPFTSAEAFRNLMLQVGWSDDNAADTPDDMQQQWISNEQLLEIIGIVDRYAVIAPSRALTYSLLSVARLLSAMGADEQRVQYYDKRLLITKAFDDYEKNGYVDSTALDTIIADDDNLIENDYQLNEAVAKFKILQSLRNRQGLQSLAEIREMTLNPSIRNAADLAMALLLTHRFEFANMQRQLTDSINAELGVHVRASKLHDFGIESQEVEFKSSIIFPAGNHMQPSRLMQGAVIMQTISGFLNSDNGGTLYLGVNKDGAACGVDNDLKFLNTDQDGYGRYVHGMINKELGQIANQCCIDCHWMTDGAYKVYVMKIKPCSDLVAFKGQYWIRQDTEKRPLQPDNVEQFRKMHSLAYQRYLANR